MQLFSDEVLRIVLNFSNPQKQDMEDTSRLASRMSQAFRNVVRESTAAGKGVQDVVDEIRELDKSLDLLQKNSLGTNVNESVVGMARKMLATFTPERVSKISSTSGVYRDPQFGDSEGTSLRIAIMRAFTDLDKRIEEAKQGRFEKVTGKSPIGTGLFFDTETAFDPRSRQNAGRFSDQLVEVTAQLFRFKKATGEIIEAQAGFYHGFQDLAYYNQHLKLPTGLTRDQLSGQSISPLALNNLIDRADFLVAHNAPFDVSAIRSALPNVAQRLALNSTVGEPSPELPRQRTIGTDERPVLDSLRGIPWRTFGFGSRALQDLLRFNNIDPGQSHRSSDDVSASVELLGRRSPLGGQTFLSSLLGSQGPANSNQAIVASLASAAEDVRTALFSRLGESAKTAYRTVRRSAPFAALGEDGETIQTHLIESVEGGYEARSRRPARSNNYGVKYGTGQSEESTPGQLGYAAVTLDRKVGVLNEFIRNIAAMTGPGASSELVSVFSGQAKFQEDNQAYGGQRLRKKEEVRSAEDLFLHTAAGTNTQLRNRRELERVREPGNFNALLNSQVEEFYKDQENAGPLLPGIGRISESRQRILEATLRQAQLSEAPRRDPNHPAELARVANSIGRGNPGYDEALAAIVQAQEDNRERSRAVARARRLVGGFSTPSSARSASPALDALSMFSQGAPKRFRATVEPQAEPEVQTQGFYGPSTYRKLAAPESDPVQTVESQRKKAESEKSSREAERRRLADEVTGQQPDTSGLSAREGRFARFSVFPPPNREPRQGFSFGRVDDVEGGSQSFLGAGEFLRAGRAVFGSIGRGIAGAASAGRRAVGSIFSGGNEEPENRERFARAADELRQVRRDDAIARLYKSADAAARALDEYATSIAPQKAAKVQADLRAKQEKISQQLAQDISRNDDQVQSTRARFGLTRERIDQRRESVQGRFEDRQSRLALNELFANDALASGEARLKRRAEKIERSSEFKKADPKTQQDILDERVNEPLKKLETRAILSSFRRAAFESRTQEEHDQVRAAATEGLVSIYAPGVAPGTTEELAVRARVEASLPTRRGGRIDTEAVLGRLGAARTATEEAEAERIAQLNRGRTRAKQRTQERQEEANSAAGGRILGIFARRDRLQDDAQRKRTAAEAAEDRLRQRFALEDEARGPGGRGGGGGGGGGVGGGLPSARNGLDFGIGLAALAGYSAALRAVSLETVQYAARTEQLNLATQQLAKTNYLNVGSVEAYVGAVRRQNVTTQEANAVVQKLIQGQLDVSKAPQLAKVAQNLSVISGQDPSDVLHNVLTGITTGQTRILHQSGLQVSAIATNRELRSQLGREPSEFEKRQGLLNAVLVEGARTFGVYEVSLATAAGQFSLLSRNIAETKNAIGNEFLPQYTRALQIVDSGLKTVQAHPEAAANIGAAGISLGVAAGVGGTAAFGRYAVGTLLRAGAANAGRATLGTALGFGEAAAEGSLLAGVAGLGVPGLIGAAALTGIGLATYSQLRQDPNELREQTARKSIDNIKEQMAELEKLRTQARKQPPGQGLSAETGLNTWEYYTTAIKSGAERIVDIQRNLTAELASEYGKRIEQWHGHLRDLAGDNGLLKSLSARLGVVSDLLTVGGDKGSTRRPTPEGIPSLGITGKQVEAAFNFQESEQRKKLSLDPNVARELSQHASDVGLVRQVAEEEDKLERGFEPGGKFDRQKHRRTDTPRARLQDELDDFNKNLKDVSEARKRISERVKKGDFGSVDVLREADRAAALSDTLRKDKVEEIGIEAGKLTAQRNVKIISTRESASVGTLAQPLRDNVASERVVVEQAFALRSRFAQARFSQVPDIDKLAEEQAQARSERDVAVFKISQKQRDERSQFFVQSTTLRAADRSERILQAPGAGNDVLAITRAADQEKFAARQTLAGTKLQSAELEINLRERRDITAAVREEARAEAEVALVRRKNTLELQNVVERVQASRGGRSEGQQAVEDIERQRARAVEFAVFSHQEKLKLPGSDATGLALEEQAARDSANKQAAGLTVVERDREVDVRRRELVDTLREDAQKRSRIGLLQATNPADEINAAREAHLLRLEYIEREFAARGKTIDAERARQKQTLDEEYSEVERILSLRKARVEEARNFSGGLFDSLPANTANPRAIPQYLRGFLLGQARTIFQNTTGPIVEGAFKNLSNGIPGQLDKDGKPTLIGRIFGGTVFAKRQDEKVDIDKELAKVTSQSVSAEKDLTQAVRSLDQAIRAAGNLSGGSSTGPEGAGTGAGGSGGSSGGGGEVGGGAGAGSGGTGGAAGGSASAGVSAAGGILSSIFPATASSVSAVQKISRVPGITQAFSKVPGLAGLFSTTSRSTTKAGAGDDVGHVPDHPRTLIVRGAAGQSESQDSGGLGYTPTPVTPRSLPSPSPSSTTDDVGYTPTKQRQLIYRGAAESGQAVQQPTTVSQQGPSSPTSSIFSQKDDGLIKNADGSYSRNASVDLMRKSSVVANPDGSLTNYGTYTKHTEGPEDKPPVDDPSQHASSRLGAIQTALSSFSAALGGSGGAKGLQKGTHNDQGTATGDTGAAAVGDYLGIGATVLGGGLQAYQGFKRGGGKGIAQGIAGTLTAASVIPGPQQPFVAAAAITAELVSALLGDPKAKREADIQQQLQLQKYLAPVTVNREITTHGDLASQGIYGLARSSGLAGFPISITQPQRIKAGVQGTLDTQYIDIAGRVNGPSGQLAAGTYGTAQYISPSNVVAPAPPPGTTVNIHLPVHAMDSADVLRRSPDIAAAVSKELKIGGGAGDLSHYINQSVFGAG